MLHSPQKSIKFVNLHYFSTKKLKSLRSRLPILKVMFGQTLDFVNTSTLGLPWEYCASTLGVLPQYSGSTAPVPWDYPGCTVPVLWEYCASIDPVLC